MINQIIKIVSKHFETDITTRKRDDNSAEGRAVYYKIVRYSFPHLSLFKTGKGVNRDHATVLNGLKQFESVYIFDDIFYHKYIKCRKDVDKVLIRLTEERSDDETKIKILQKENKELEKQVIQLQKEISKMQQISIHLKESGIISILKELDIVQLNDFKTNRLMPFVRMQKHSQV